MGINDKAFRLRAARDLLHLKGRHEPTFKRKIELIIEILGMIHSPRNLSYSRREAAKLRDATPNPTPEQLSLLGVLDDRLFKKSELIKARQERKKAVKAGRTKRRPQLVQAGLVTPVPISRNSEEIRESDKLGRENRPGDPDFHSVLEEFEG